MFKGLNKVGSVVGGALVSAGAFAAGAMPEGLQTAIDDNLDTLGLVGAAMLAIPLGFLAVKLVLRAIRNH